MKYLENLINAFASLPSIGKKNARRLAYHIINQNKENALRLSNAIIEVKNNLQLCQKCFNISEDCFCEICKDEKRIPNQILIVENFPDIVYFEEMNEYKGLYLVIGGLLNPLDGIGPSNLNFEALISRIKQEDISEIILGISHSLEGDTTALYIKHILSEYNLKIYRLAKGMPQGGEIEYTDKYTLKESFKNKQIF